MPGPARWIACLSCAAAFALGGCGADSAPTKKAPTPAAESTPGPAIEPEATADAQRAWSSVIVDLAVEWKPESTLTPDERRTQRSRIEAAQDEVLKDLGTNGRLNRRLTETAQMSVSVDDEGRAILDGHRLVARVHEDEPQPPAAADGS